jgi:hypothetical protein
MLAVAIRGRMDWDPSVLPGFLLAMSGFGVVLLVSDSLSSTSTAKGLAELGVAVALLVLFLRIWRANEGSGCVALLFTLSFGLRSYLRHSLYHRSPSDWDVSWFNLIYAVVLLEISVGLWRAHAWARWAAGLASILSSTRFVLMLVGVYPKDRTPPPALSAQGVLLMSFALFWAAITLYLCLPSTGERFDEMRDARE